MNTSTDEVTIDPYYAIKTTADIMDKNYFCNSNNGNFIMGSKDFLLFQLQYYIRYSQALENRIKELENNKKEGAWLYD